MSEISVTSFLLGSWQKYHIPGQQFKSPIDGSKLSNVTEHDIPSEDILKFSRNVGIKNLQKLNFHDRARILKRIGLLLNDAKEKLYSLSYHTGATLKDSYLDIDGGIGTLLVMASKARKEMDESFIHLDGDVEIISRKGTFLGQHIFSPLQGVAIHINAFNFPIWGMLEKLSSSILAGVPTIVKPSASTSFLAQECMKIISESNLLPEGALQFIPGRTNDLLDKLIGQDIVSFTGSSETGFGIRSNPNLIKNSVKFISEQDSLNACIMGEDVEIDDLEWDVFLKEVVNEITSKAGQKCTAIRKIFVPENKLKATIEALKEKLESQKVDDPRKSDTDMGPIVSLDQKNDVISKISEILEECDIITGKSNLEKDSQHAGTAYMEPMLLYCSNPNNAENVHELEVFGPSATIMGYKSNEEVANLVVKGGGSLVSSIFSNDLNTIKNLSLKLAPYNGRIYINNRESMDESTGHGSPLPHMKHGGPGRAGNSEELGGIRGVTNYMQRTAIQSSPNSLSKITNTWIEGSNTLDPGIHPFKKNFNTLMIGDTIISESREITLEDVEHFAEFTGDKFYAHMDENAAKLNPFFPGRVAHGYLLVSFAAGLFVDPDPGPVLANTGLKNLSFEKPVSPGDKIKVQLSVRKKKRRTETYGEVGWSVKLENQNKDTVAKYELLTMNSYTS